MKEKREGAVRVAKVTQGLPVAPLLAPGGAGRVPDLASGRNGRVPAHGNAREARLVPGRGTGGRGPGAATENGLAVATDAGEAVLVLGKPTF